MNQSQKIIELDIHERDDIKRHCKELLFVFDEIERKMEKVNLELKRGIDRGSIDKRKVSDLLKDFYSALHTKAGKFFFRK